MMRPATETWRCSVLELFGGEVLAEGAELGDGGGEAEGVGVAGFGVGERGVGGAGEGGDLG